MSCSNTEAIANSLLAVTKIAKIARKAFYLLEKFVRGRASSFRWKL